MNEAGVQAGGGGGSNERRKIHFEKTQVSLTSNGCYAGDNTYWRNFVGQKKEEYSVLQCLQPFCSMAECKVYWRKDN